MKNYILLSELADELGIDRGNLLTKLQEKEVKTVLSPAMTQKGPRMARWVPITYANQLREFYKQARNNTNETTN